MDTHGAVLLGSQVPTYEWVPPAPSSAGQDAVDFSAGCGLVMDPWQARSLEGGLGEDPVTDRWVVNEVGIVAPRQNGKGGIIEARELAGIFVFRERMIMHSAHEFKTSARAFLRMKAIIESNPDLDRRVVAISNSKGDEGFTFRIDPRRPRELSWLRYMARTGGAGRGFEGVTCVILDEAMILDDPPIAAMLPTMAAHQPPGRWQVWYLGSAGDVRLPTESVVLARVRRRGIRKEPGLMYAEWAAHLRHTKECPPDCQLDDRMDPRTWAKTCPALGRRISEQFLRKMAGGAMAAWDFDREFLSCGQWPAVEDGWAIVAEQIWNDMKDPASHRGREFAVGFESKKDASMSSASIASLRDDGFYHAEMIENRPGTAWIPEYAVALRKKRPVAFVVDPKGPAAAVIPDLKRAKLEVVEPTLPQYAQWCAKATQLLTETHSIRHLDQDTMNKAIKATPKRDLGHGAYVWERFVDSADVTPWIAWTMALGGLIVKGGKRRRLRVAAVSHGPPQRGE